MGEALVVYVVGGWNFDVDGVNVWFPFVPQMATKEGEEKLRRFCYEKACLCVRDKEAGAKAAAEWEQFMKRAVERLRAE